MRVASPDQMRECDRVTIELRGVPGLTLMEQAGEGAARVIIEYLGDVTGRKIVILCGKGNNGGDGFVVARLLHDRGARVRAFCLGEPDETFRKVYQTVLDAQLAAMSIINEGTTGQQADSAARTVIEKAGYGEAFGHALGHGIGLAPHELPRLGQGSTEPLTAGMVFTVEPGIYLPEWGGIRIEDTVSIENGKAEAISKARKVRYD